jgi:plastocyanin
VTARRSLLALTGVAAVAAAPALALGASAPRKTIGVHDNYYGPAKVTVKAGTTVRWVWEDDANDVHDVKLQSAPAGVRKFQTEPLAIGDTFSKKLTKPGTYKIICTFHEEEMTMRITVKKAATRR